MTEDEYNRIIDCLKEIQRTGHFKSHIRNALITTVVALGCLRDGLDLDWDYD